MGFLDKLRPAAERCRLWSMQPGNLLLGALGLLLLVAASWYIFRWGPADSMLLANIWPPPLILGASLLAWRAARHPNLHPALRKVWHTFALAFAAWGLATLLWSLSYSLLGTKPFPSLIDLLFLSFYPWMCWGILTYPRADAPHRGQVRTALDVLVVLIPGWVLVWTYGLQPALSHKEFSLLETVLSVGYPLGDLALLAGTVTAWLRSTSAQSKPLLLLSLGLLLLVGGDMTWMYQENSDTFLPGGLSDLLWCTAYFLMALSAHQMYRRAEEGGETVLPNPPDRTAISRRSIIVLLGGYLSLMAIEATFNQDPSPVIRGAARAGELLVLIRLAVAVLDSHRLQVQVEQSAVRFRAMAENLSDGILVVGDQSKVLYQSPRIQEVFGLPSLESTANLYKLIHPDDLPAVRSWYYRSVLSPGETLMLDWRYTRPDGSIGRVEGSVRNLQHDPLVGGMIYTVRDITERHEMEEALQRANAELEDRVRERTQTIQVAYARLEQELGERRRVEEALRLSESQYRTLAQTAPDAILTVDRAGMVEYANEGASSMFGCPAAAMIGRPLALLLPKVGMKLANHIAAGRYQARLTEATGVRCDGSELHLDLSAGYFESPAGPRVTVVLRDVGDRREAQARIRAAEEERERIRTRFLQIAAHELRNPMGGVLAMLSLQRLLVANGQPLDQFDEMAAAMEREITRLSSLLDEILTAFRTQEGRLQVRRAPVDLVQVTMLAITPLQALNGRRKLRTDEITAGPVWVTGDSDRLEEVVRNLLSNAVKYSPEGSEIQVGLQANHQTGDVTLWVRDNGLGVPEEQLAAIFEGFARGRNLQGRDPGGMGLGLYVSKEILELHGGRIWCESTEGHGSTFYFTLPLLPAKEG